MADNDETPNPAWLPGRCAYCGADDIQTVEVDSVHTGSGAGYPIRACAECLPLTGTDLTTIPPPPEPQGREELRG